MIRFRQALFSLLALATIAAPSRGDDHPAAPRGDASRRVYGEWRIRVKPDKGSQYNRLIETAGLPLFREGGGRMVGWWKTVVGDLYEHVTIWEYDDMAAFEGVGGILSKNPAFAKFVEARDPLLTGEESRFLRLAPGAEPPALAEPAPFLIHEIHRVPLARRAAYLDFMTQKGLPLLKANGFRPVGPWVVDVGRWTEVTYLFRFDGLAERERRIAEFSAKADAKLYGAKVEEFVHEVSTRLLAPAPFTVATPPKAASTDPTLPHHAEIAPGVHAAGFSDRHRSANCGWVALEDETLLVDLPRGIPVPEFLALVAGTTGKPARTLVLTNAVNEDVPIIRTLLEHGVSRVLTSPGVQAQLLKAPNPLDPASLSELTGRSAIGTAAVPVEFQALDEVAGQGGAVVHLPAQSVLFAGPLVFHGPRAPLPGSDTALWSATLRRLESLAPSRVVPGFGSWGGPELLTRQGRLLSELRRQVSVHVAQGRSLADLRDQVRLATDCFVWMPYDTPTADDLDHVYHELTVPVAPFHGQPPAASDQRPHALVLIGDQPHEPGHIEEGLRPVFEATGVIPHFTVDVKSLSAENLAKVRLLVILRDGLQRPTADSAANYPWMTPEQERAVVAFVERGGGFLNLHNSMGLYPDDGPYLKLVGGRYIGHGPLERFQVEVVDPEHPITRGVSGFFVADEQHTPPIDEQRVHLLLRNRSDDGKTAAAGWTREPGKGRLCHLANGHTREALLHPMFQKLMRNATRWCLRIEDSKQAAGAENAAGLPRGE